jgi:hypothetical protein
MGASLKQFNAIIGWNFGKDAKSFYKGTFYVALSLYDLTGIGDIIPAYEPSAAAGYDRVAITNNKTTWTTAANGELFNAIPITFPTSTGSWGTIRAICFAGIAGGGGAAEIAWYANFPYGISVPINTTVSFLANTIRVALT